MPYNKLLDLNVIHNLKWHLFNLSKLHLTIEYLLNIFNELI